MGEVVEGVQAVGPHTKHDPENFRCYSEAWGGDAYYRIVYWLL